jgi:uncharacterized protein
MVYPKAYVFGQLLVAIVTSGFFAAGCSAPPTPKACSVARTGEVVDQANILSAASEAELNVQVQSLDRQSSDELAIATTTSMDGSAIEMYSIDLARCWDLGAGNAANGIMVLIAPNERQARIEVSRGLEGVIKDEEASVIMKTLMVPNFAKGDFDAGVKSGVAAIIKELTEDRSAASARQAANHAQGQKR